MRSGTHADRLTGLGAWYSPVGRSWLMDRGVADECSGIIDDAAHIAALPPGRLRTGAATEVIERAMLRRRGIDVTVRSYRMRVGRIYWVPGPKSQVHQRHEVAGGEGNDD